MSEALSAMLAKYKCRSVGAYENALKEIIQEIALLGLWRARFFEKAAFYGGTALRLFYGLDRFSEDLDFSLLKSMPDFDISNYCVGIRSELTGFGLSAEVRRKEKRAGSQIQSAFIKAGTMKNLIIVKTPEQWVKKIPGNHVLKIKLEVDVDPPPGFTTESRYLLQPIPFSVTVFRLPDLFAGKMHALLCREWKTRVKGRDWYDLVWYIGRGVPLGISHLEKRMKQTGHLAKDERLSKNKLVDLFIKRIGEVDLGAAKKDVTPMLKDPAAVQVWSRDFFEQLAQRIQFG